MAKFKLKNLRQDLMKSYVLMDKVLADSYARGSFTAAVRILPRAGQRTATGRSKNSVRINTTGALFDAGARLAHPDKVPIAVGVAGLAGRRTGENVFMTMGTPYRMYVTKYYPYATTAGEAGHARLEADSTKIVKAGRSS